MIPKTISTENLTTASAQEVFDFVAFSLLKQGKKSEGFDTATNNLLCFYRGDENTKCAGGFLIPDEIYAKEEMEGRGWGTLINQCNFSQNHQDLICQLQSTHDNHEPDNWKFVLDLLAKRHNLSSEALESFVSGGDTKN